MQLPFQMITAFIFNGAMVSASEARAELAQSTEFLFSKAILKWNTPTSEPGGTFSLLRFFGRQRCGRPGHRASEGLSNGDIIAVQSLAGSHTELHLGPAVRA